MTSGQINGDRQHRFVFQMKSILPTKKRTAASRRRVSRPIRRNPLNATVRVHRTTSPDAHTRNFSVHVSHFTRTLNGSTSISFGDVVVVSSSSPVFMYFVLTYLSTFQTFSVHHVADSAPNTARKVRGIFCVDPEDEELKSVMKNARRKLEVAICSSVEKKM